MRFAKILCGTDFSAGSQQALRVATQLANEHDAELVITHVWWFPPQAHSAEYVFPPPMFQQLVDGAQHGLDEAQRDAVAAGVRRVRAVLLHGVPWVEIETLIEQEGIELCVVGTHGRSGLARILLGSVAERVVRHASCAVLAVRPHREHLPFAHVLVPTDFSADACHAADVAAGLVGDSGRLTLLHVFEVPVASTGVPPLPGFELELDKRACASLDQEAARLRQATRAKVTSLSRIGSAGAETLAAVDDDPSVDLVVMGSYGRTGITRVLLGSVAEKLVRHARCPVLVTRLRR